jgi:tRNA(Ile)-lysidine synthase
MNAAWARMEAVLTGGDLIPPGCGVVVAVSGGRDSMVLLSALDRCRMRLGWRLVVAHFHHQLRGVEADADQALVAVTAARFGVPFVAGTADVEAMRDSGESWETAARRLRHAFLARVARDQGCSRVALGHHAGDQAELFLLRLLRGAGAAGLGGMREASPSPSDPGISLVRPMLHCLGVEVEDLAREWAVEFRWDATNRDTVHLRNRVRHELLPLLEARFQPGLEQVLLREQTLLRDQVDFMEAVARDWLASTRHESAHEFDHLAVALQREVLRVQAKRLALVMGFDVLERLRKVPEEPVQLGPGLRVVRDVAGGLQLVQADLPHAGGGFLPHTCDVVLGTGDGAATFGGCRIQWSAASLADGNAAMLVWEIGPRIPGRETPPSTAGGTPALTDALLERLDADVLGTKVRLRHWRPGDRFQPIGLGAAAKLQDLFTNARVPAAERRFRVLAETERGEIFWVEGLRIGECAKVRPATGRILTWRWTRIRAQTGH